MQEPEQTTEQLRETIERQRAQIDILKTTNNDLLLQLADYKAQSQVAQLCDKQVKKEQVEAIFEEEHKIIATLRLQLAVKQELIDKQKDQIRDILTHQQRSYEQQLEKLKSFFDRTLRDINKEELAKSQVDRYEELVLQLQREKQMLAEQNLQLSNINQVGISEMARSRIRIEGNDLRVDEFE